MKIDYQEQIGRQMLAAARLKELSNALHHGTVLQAENVADAWQTMAMNTRTHLLFYPNNVMPVVGAAASYAVLLEILTAGMTDALYDLHPFRADEIAQLGKEFTTTGDDYDET